MSSVRCTMLRGCTAARLRRGSVAASASAKPLLYANPRTRSKIVEWYLQELGVSYDTKEIDMAEKQHKSADFLKINPFGKVPALVDGSLQLFESGAMLQYAADKWGGADTPEKRAEVGKWVLFANSTLGNALFLDQFRETQLPVCMQPLEDVLSKQPFLVGGEFGAADVAVGAYLLYIPLMLAGKVDLAPYPAVQEYMARLQARPACTIQPPPAAES